MDGIIYALCIIGFASAICSLGVVLSDQWEKRQNPLE